MTMRARGFTALIALMLVGAGCASGSGDDVTIAHVHGLGVMSDTLFVATHHGLYAYQNGEWSQRSSDRADHMGFSLVSERLMFRSGHPEKGGNLGVQRSTDGGREWDTTSDVLDSPVDFHAMAGSRSRPVVLYGWSQGLFRSIGDPEEWEPVQLGALPPQIGALAVGRDGAVFASTGGGVYRSTDRARSWKRMGPELVFALASGGARLYASKAEGGGVLRSTDDGESWEDAGRGLGSTPIVALATSADGETVVAADQEAGIWRSENAGKAWTRVPTP